MTMTRNRYYPRTSDAVPGAATTSLNIRCFSNVVAEINLFWDGLQPMSKFKKQNIWFGKLIVRITASGTPHEATKGC